jgi:hypothetical protein
MCGFEEFYQGKGLAPSGDRGLRVEIFSNPGKLLTQANRTATALKSPGLPRHVNLP